MSYFSRRGSSASALSSFSIAVTSQSSRRSSVASLSDFDQDHQDADKLAFQECIEIIDANVEDVITNKADAREKKWWKDGNYKIIDEERLPLNNR
ncbi:9715_t:CDS:2 [Paraglomus brasilianum]|uniref:9715_t:CDS:1 n=1 Tax=Paraglomus brasilianum TaxID=144538 RepID=A0A9N8ZG27_9GLOM|nr:9715_t:CDS:2 [Paraglomus brasilianum]